MGQSSQAELCRKHNLSGDQLSKWKHQLVDNTATLFESTDKHATAPNERIAQLEQLVGRLTYVSIWVERDAFEDSNPRWPMGEGTSPLRLRTHLI